MNTVLEIPKLVSSIVLDPPLSDAEFEQLSMSTEMLKLERTKEGAIVVNAPAGGFTSDANVEIVYQLRAWWDRHEKGRVFGQDVGFFLPDGSSLSPDAAYIRREKSRQITEEAGLHFLRMCPDFVIELMSPSDKLVQAKKKMEAWIANGAELAWLIDPKRKQVLVYEPGKDARVEKGASVKGAGPVNGFTLNLAKVWRRYQRER